MSVLDFLHAHLNALNDMSQSMYKQSHPHYGNGVRAITACEQLAKDLLENLPTVEAWITEYAANRKRLWLRSMLEMGTAIVNRYSSHSIWRTPEVPTLSPLTAWSRVEATYTGALDVKYAAVLEASYAIARRLAEIPDRHTGPCTGGLVCFDCEDDEWRWSQKVHAEADAEFSQNIFWKPRLQPQFLAEIVWDGWDVPEEWTFPCGKPREWSWNPTGCTTPFQYARELVDSVASRFRICINRNSDEYQVYKTLVEVLPGLREDIPQILVACEEVRGMY